MQLDPWDTDILQRINTNVLLRSANRFSESLTHLEKYSFSGVDRIVYALKSINAEISRRALGNTKPLESKTTQALPDKSSEYVSLPQIFSIGLRDQKLQLLTRQAEADGFRDAVSSAHTLDKTIEFYTYVQMSALYHKELTAIATLLAPDGTVRCQTSNIDTLLGYDARNIVGKNVETFLVPESADQLQAYLDEMARNEVNLTEWKLQFEAASGNPIWLRGSSVNLIKDPLLPGIMVFWSKEAEC